MAAQAPVSRGLPRKLNRPSSRVTMTTTASLNPARRPSALSAIAPPVAVLFVVVAATVWLGLRELHEVRATTRAAVPRSATSAPAAAAAAPRASLDALARSTLFGEVQASEGAAEEAAPPAPTVVDDSIPEELPVATLGVTVQGIVFDPEGTSSRVLLGGGAAEPRAYAVGDELPGSVTIRHIEATRVVVKHDGELKELPLDEIDARGGARLTRAAPARPARQARGATPPPAPTSRGAASAAVMRLRDIAARNGIPVD